MILIQAKDEELPFIIVAVPYVLVESTIFGHKLNPDFETDYDRFGYAEEYVKYQKGVSSTLKFGALPYKINDEILIEYLGKEVELTAPGWFESGFHRLTLDGVFNAKFEEIEGIQYLQITIEQYFKRIERKSHPISSAVGG